MNPSVACGDLKDEERNMMLLDQCHCKILKYLSSARKSRVLESIHLVIFRGETKSRHTNSLGVVDPELTSDYHTLSATAILMTISG